MEDTFPRKEAPGGQLVARLVEDISTGHDPTGRKMEMNGSESDFPTILLRFAHKTNISTHRRVGGWCIYALGSAICFKDRKSFAFLVSNPFRGCDIVFSRCDSWRDRKFSFGSRSGNNSGCCFVCGCLLTSNQSPVSGRRRKDSTVQLLADQVTTRPTRNVPSRG
ncbi:hypothetical protein ZHAS_00004695 [Anopheles sinensis]|uniref:Uncharacterized protein n=1 Tax=Anopheles sinensis TaxID=74873 RepID=A0A084VHF2_ANOSI|nr:hypothetical protein ZHAS_00004695 [Anopheles sinensis]